MGIPLNSLPKSVQDKIAKLNLETEVKQELTMQAEKIAGVVRLIFPFRAISKDNEKCYNRSGRFFLSKKFKDFDKAVALKAKEQYRGKPLEGDIEVILTCNFTNKVHCDAFNLPKGIMDSLQNIIFINDKQIKKGTVIVNEGMPTNNFHVIVEF